MTDLSVTFLGTSASVPTVRRSTSAIALVRGGDYFLLDCGEGTQRQMQRFTGGKPPKAIFITHGHADHWLGLPGVLATLAMQEHSRVVEVYLPQRSAGKIQQMMQSVGIPDFVEIRPISHEDTQTFKADDNSYSFTAFSTEHTPESVGFVFEEATRPGRFDPHLAAACGIKPGPEFKALQNGEIVKGVRPEDVMGLPRKGRKIAYTGDTRPCTNTVNFAKGAGLLIHEATFEDDMVPRAMKTRHSTGTEAGEMAQQAGVERLMLTHFSPRANPTNILASASKRFRPVEAAHDGKTIKVPLDA